MLKNIILEINDGKKQRNIEPTHALFREVFDRATIEGIAPPFFFIMPHNGIRV